MNCSSVSPFFHSSLHSPLTQSLSSRRKLVARWISIASHLGKWLKASGGSVEAPCCTAPPRRYVARAAADRARSASRSSCTLAIEPSGSTTPPWLVPVCTEILLIPAYGGGPKDWSVRR